MTGHSLSFLMGPLVACVALTVIVLLMRWVFAPPPATARTRSAPAGDFGLLVPVATAPTTADAECVRETLRGAGIRCTVTPRDGDLVVLVFPDDAERASALVG